MTTFRRLPEHELGRRSDEELMAYVHQATVHCDTGAVNVAFGMLVFRHERRLRWMLHKVPDDRVDELLQEVFLDAFDAAVGGRDVGRFSAWINKVARNTVADFWRGKEGKQLKRDREAGHPSREDDADRAAIPPEPSQEGDFGAAEAHSLIDDLLARRSVAHRRVIELFVFEDRPAREVSERTGESEPNVYKVAQRFRDELRRLLRGEELDDNDEDDRT